MPQAVDKLVFEDDYQPSKSRRRTTMLGEVVRDIKSIFRGTWKWTLVALIGLLVLMIACAWIGTALND